VGEFDGTGVNVGLRIPLTSDYHLNQGFTHIFKPRCCGAFYNWFVFFRSYV